MNAADVPLGMRLKGQAGWNQVEADWRRFLDMQPDGCFVAELDGVAVGTTVACIFGRVAWIAMVLVDEQARGRGVGTALMRHALAFLDDQGVPSVRLDATALGQPVYEKLGFAAEYKLARYEGVLGRPGIGPPAESGVCVRPAMAEDHVRVVQLDQEAIGTDRGKFLTRLFRERPDDVQLAERAGRLEGYLAVRAGTSALQLGPCIATLDGGGALIADAATRLLKQRVFLDVPQPNEPAVRIAESLGLSVQRMFVRMCRGPRVADDLARLMLSSGPELG
jgi:GNAT superfamily N-acetyltransferase